MKITATTKDFMEMFSTMSMDGLYNPIVMTVKKGIIGMVAKDTADTTITTQKYKDFTIEDEIDEKLVFDTDEMLNSFKLFKSGEEITISLIDNTIVIANNDDSEMSDVITIPQMDTSVIDVMEFPYKIVKGIPTITNAASGESIDFTTITAKMPVKYLQEVVKRAGFVDVTPRIYKMDIEGGKITTRVGEKNRYQKSVETTFKVEGTGKGALIFGNGFEEMVKTMSGEITMNAMPGAPVWFTIKNKSNIVHVLMAPAMELEE